ncbi:restriction endonuclease [Tellurirhabdus bombi]|uniref:restriction endonuclease n=1 Tax=Tellurirhabdus bombi TaxID=2907205 RepID=UPI001F31DD04|nr:restriction endonuclease [Tellurirhabdus bombi]
MKTIGPLHLEDLEPHRFEDLVRQLLYDFRNWAEIEAVGRSGSDHGFDARAREASILNFDQEANYDDESNTSEQVPTAPDRVWVVQCKREKSIGPSKLASYMADLPDTQQHGLYGVVFVAACDFSFAAREAFRDAAREKGYAEAYLWGKGEIEDQLFQPKNDHLLFAYFGISLQTRKRGITTSVRAKLAAKRKVVRVLEENYKDRFVLVRDASDERYPHADGNKLPGQRLRGRWWLLKFEAVYAQGVLFKLKDIPAYLADDQKSWDYMYIDSLDMALALPSENYWTTQDTDLFSPSLHKDHLNYMEVWSELPDKSKATYLEFGIIPYENIIDIDERGDQYFEGPHLYILPYESLNGPFKDGTRSYVELDNSWDNFHVEALPENRISWFHNVKEQAEKIRAERENGLSTGS